MFPFSQWEILLLNIWLNWWKIQRESISTKNWWDGFCRNIADWRTISFESDFAWGKQNQKKVQFFINYVDQGIYRIGKLLPKTIVKVNWLFFINSNYVLQRRELTQNLKSCFPKNLNNSKSISYQFCTLQNWPHPAVSNSHLSATAYLSHTLLIQPHSSSQTRK